MGAMSSQSAPSLRHSTCWQLLALEARRALQVSERVALLSRCMRSSCLQLWRLSPGHVPWPCIPPGSPRVLGDGVPLRLGQVPWPGLTQGPLQEETFPSAQGPAGHGHPEHCRPTGCHPGAQGVGPQTRSVVLGGWEPSGRGIDGAA